MLHNKPDSSHLFPLLLNDDAMTPSAGDHRFFALGHLSEAVYHPCVVVCVQSTLIRAPYGEQQRCATKESKTWLMKQPLHNLANLLLEMSAGSAGHTDAQKWVPREVARCAQLRDSWCIVVLYELLFYNTLDNFEGWMFISLLDEQCQHMCSWFY